MFSRILTLLAGAFIGAAIRRRKEEAPTGGTPWRADLDELNQRLAEHLQAYERQLYDLRERFDEANSDTRPDRTALDLTARLADLQQKIETMAGQLAQTPDNSIHELAARISRLQPKIETLATELAPKPDPRVDAILARQDALELQTIPEVRAQIADLSQAVTAQDQKLQATSRVVLAIEQMLNTSMAEFDRRLEAQGRALQAMNSSIAQSDELLERLLDLVQPAAAAGRNENH